MWHCAATHEKKFPSRKSLFIWKMTSNYRQHIYPHLVNSKIMSPHIRNYSTYRKKKFFGVIIQFFPRDNSKLSVLLLLWEEHSFFWGAFIVIIFVCIRCDFNAILIAILRYCQRFFILLNFFNVCLRNKKYVWYRITMICNRNGREK